jgi:tetratricopeptide (TPR) repeat protein
MRSSVSTGFLVLTSLALAPALLAATGCGGSTEPAPTKLERQTPFDRGAPRPAAGPDDLLRNPATDTPRAREGAQLTDDEIDAILAEAEEHMKVDNVALARTVLQKCANKVPASARCDGHLGLTMADAKNWRATAHYYLMEAASVDDPKADAALYLKIGEALRRHGRTEHAILALDKAVARDPSAEPLFALGRVLSLVQARLPEGAERIAEARAMDDKIEWLYEEAVIRGQIPVREQAARSLQLFEDYKTRAESLPAESLPSPTTSLAGRMAELEALVKIYPTQAEFDAKQLAKQLDGGASEPGSSNATPSTSGPQ